MKYNMQSIEDANVPVINKFLGKSELRQQQMNFLDMLNM